MIQTEDMKANILSLIDSYYKQLEKREFIPGETKIQYSGPIFDQEEVKAVLSSLLDGWLVVGKQTTEFEESFASLIGAKGCVTVNSGSSALLIAWAALKNRRLRKRLKDDSEVITTALTHPATINCLLQNGLKPVLIDVDGETLNIAPSLIEEATSDKTGGLLPMHFLGNPCDMAPIQEIAKKYQLFIVEDCCDAYGGEYHNAKLGTWGDLAAISFYVAHALTMGEGGAVLYNDSKYRPVLRSLRAWGVACATCSYTPCRVAIDPTFECPMRFKTKTKLGEWDSRHLFVDIGYNLKTIEMQAAFGVEQIKKLPFFVEKRKENWEYLVKSLKDYHHFLAPQKPTPNSQPAWFGVAFTVRPQAPFTRKDLIQWLEEHRIETRHFFAGDIRHQPAYRNIPFKVVGNLENTTYARENGFFIGCYPGITKEMREYMVTVFNDFFKKFK